MTGAEFMGIRKSLGMTKAEMARALRVSGTRTIHRWESGRRVPGPVSIVMEFFAAYPPWIQKEGREEIGNQVRA